ncbi:MAG TPA: hypothetical protein VF011_09480 [Terriglobales bacterium]
MANFFMVLMVVPFTVAKLRVIPEGEEIIVNVCPVAGENLLIRAIFKVPPRTTGPVA